MLDSNSEKIVVTGIGVVSPCGIGVEKLWSSARDGISSADYIPGVDLSAGGSCIGCMVSDFDPTEYMEPRKARRIDRSSQLAVAASQLAVNDAGLDLSKTDLKRVGIAEGTNLGGIEWLLHQYDIYNERGLARVSPFTISSAFVGAASVEMAIHFGIKGPTMTFCNKCAAGADAIGMAMKTILNGEAEIMIAGGSEAPLVFPIMAFFNRMGVLSKLTDNPARACRPFDSGRGGIVLGEGAAFVVLEKEKSAQKRGARIRCYVSGYGRTCDAHHITAPSPDGECAAEAMRLAIKSAGKEPFNVDYINAHGTATELNDPVEAMAIRSALGPWGDEVLVSSTKPITGHLMGAAGAVEAVITIKAIEEQTVPPNINLDRPDPECRMNIVSPKAVSAEIETAISNSFGFGGKNTTLLFTRYNP